MAIRKRTTKLLARRHDLDYFKKGSPIRLWQWRLAAVLLVAAALWIAYGFATGSLPVIASNTAVAFMAVVYPVIRQAAERARTSPGADTESFVRSPPYEELPQIV